MTDKLIIVESPAKANTIKKFLGGNTKVVASMGHIRDLPKSKLGVNVDNDFEPEYINIRGKANLIKELKKDADSAKEVYLATDPDREGEAIAWHLAHILEIDENKYERVINFIKYINGIGYIVVDYISAMINNNGVRTEQNIYSLRVGPELDFNKAKKKINKYLEECYK